MAKKTETGRINSCDHTTNAGGTATVTRTAWNPRQKLWFLLLAWYYCYNFFQSFFPLSPVRGRNPDGTQEQHPHCPPPPPNHEHKHRSKRTHGEPLTRLAAPAPARWVGRKAAAAWGARSRNAGEKPTGRPPKNPSRPGPRAFLFSFLLCALTSSLSLSRPGSSNKAGRKMGALASLVSLQAPPPTLEVTAHGVKCSGNAGAATVNCTANPCGL